MSDEDREKEEGIVGVFSRSASTFDRGGPRIFSHFGQRLVDLAHIPPGAEVLDVAAGRGAVLFPAAKQAGLNGRVVGIDLSADMVRETTAEMQGFGWQHATMHQMDAEQLDFADASFDWVLCGFALWFFPQPYRALTEFSRVLRPGGGVGLTTWAEDCPFLQLCREAFRPYLPPASAADQGSEEAPRFDTPMRLEAALRKIGLTESQITVEEADFVFPDEETVWVRLWSGGFRGRLERLAAPAREELKADLFQQLQHLKQPDGIHTLWRALFALGSKPQ